MDECLESVRTIYAVLAAASISAVQIPPLPKLMPVDEARQDAAVAGVRDQVLAAAKGKNARTVMSFVSPSVLFGTSREASDATSQGEGAIRGGQRSCGAAGPRLANAHSHQQAVEDRLRAGRTAGDVDIDGKNTIDSPHRRVCRLAEDAATAPARADRADDTRLGRRLPGPAERDFHIACHR